MVFKGEIPFVRLLVPLILGIMLGLMWPGKDQWDWAVIIIVSLLVVFSLLIRFYKKNIVYRQKWLPGFLIQVIILLAGYTGTLSSAQRYNANYFPNLSSEALIVVVRNEPQLSGNILRFETSVEESFRLKTKQTVSGKLLVALSTDSLVPITLSYGDKLLIPAQYNDVDPPFNPAEFNYQKYLGNKQFYKQTFLNQRQVRVLSHHAGNRVIAFALRVRKQLVGKFYKYLIDEDAAALASTLILGYRANLSKEVISAYSRTGTMHVLSVSGMHVAIVFVVLAFLMRPLSKHSKLRYISAFIIIGSIWIYALLTGFSPSVCRAAMMLSFVVLGKALNKDLNTYNLLAISAFFLLIYNPYNLVDIGFQLSYLAVIGLIYFQPKIYHSLYIKNRFLDYLWSYSALSISAQLATFPISLYYFHQFPVYFLVSNLVVVLPVAFIMYAGIAFLFIPWPIVLIPLGDFINAVIIYTNKCLFYIEDLPFASIGGIWINTFQYVLIYLIVLLVTWSFQTAKKLAVYLTLGAICLFSISIMYRQIYNGRNKELIFYSLRKNTALVYINSEKAYLISDLKNDEKVRSFSINPAIERKGVSYIEYIKLGSIFANDEITVSSFYMQFGNFRLIRWSKELDDVAFSGKIMSDGILLSGNPQIDVKQLKENVKFSLLLIDASNYEYRIKRWTEEAKLLNVPVHILKKQPAYVLKL